MLAGADTPTSGQGPTVREKKHRHLSNHVEQMNIVHPKHKHSDINLVRKTLPLESTVSTDETAWNFEAEYNDHFETPQRAYADITCVLELLAEELGKAKANLVVYDPYYCKGSMVRHMASLGYSNVINSNRDFYVDIKTKAIPGIMQMIVIVE